MYIICRLDDIYVDYMINRSTVDVILLQRTFV
ncbi:hypothetical protein EhV236 [Emiliania huxleyi virus 86]|uniref:Uncharacterized protein n=1 Tax=Emiliania huxleyi virus 86 (isolate United Kingdom/English Channel/1999) TaxID=654925 RepID=Q4A2P6_EHV8U|nr:hypothetical protein EhV236 [Emiliania huxleyi virus 86]CAI65660.1 hypothetical protein EhV236 [Emiliania huxleyi virus 86]